MYPQSMFMANYDKENIPVFHRKIVIFTAKNRNLSYDVASESLIISVINLWIKYANYLDKIVPLCSDVINNVAFTYGRKIADYFKIAHKMPVKL